MVRVKRSGSGTGSLCAVTSSSKRRSTREAGVSSPASVRASLGRLRRRYTTFSFPHRQREVAGQTNRRRHRLRGGDVHSCSCCSRCWLFHSSCSSFDGRCESCCCGRPRSFGADSLGSCDVSIISSKKRTDLHPSRRYRKGKGGATRRLLAGPGLQASGMSGCVGGWITAPPAAVFGAWASTRTGTTGWPAFRRSCGAVTHVPVFRISAYGSPLLTSIMCHFQLPGELCQNYFTTKNNSRQPTLRSYTCCEA